MSSMLEQAIIDATALREAAIKNAETSIIEKYSTEIKGMVDNLLEQEALGDEFGEAEEAGPEGSEKRIIDEMPLAATEGNDMCPCPDEEQLVKIDIPEIIKQLEDEGEAGLDTDMEDLADRGDLAAELGQEEEELQEEVEIDDEMLMSLIEDLEIDIEPVKSGWLETPTSYVQRAEEEAEALEAHLDEEDEEEDSPLGGLDLKEVEEKTKGLEESITKLKKENKLLFEQNREYKDMMIEMRDTLNEVTAQNARLLYTNQALGSNSLNGRQKNKIVEAISNADTVEEAKVIFETLQSTVGSSATKKSSAPKSLSEAVVRRSSALVSRREEKPQADPRIERMRRLAGLD
jgi:hypothetical protein